MIVAESSPKPSPNAPERKVKIDLNGDNHYVKA